MLLMESSQEVGIPLECQMYSYFLSSFRITIMNFYHYSHTNLLEAAYISLNLNNISTILIYIVSYALMFLVP